MLWCNMFQCWCDDVEYNIGEETLFAICGRIDDEDCSDCDYSNGSDEEDLEDEE